MIKFFTKSHDGGANSGVTAYFLIEWKRVFSVAVLRFSKGSREAFHSHAFNALTWWLKGAVREEFPSGNSLDWRPSFKPKLTPRRNIHKIVAQETSWAFTLRGPWVDRWIEYKTGKEIVLSHGRKVISEKPLVCN